MQSSVWNLIAEGRRPVGRLLMVATAVAGVVSLCAPAARAQDELAEAVEWARLAWLGHDVSRLVSRSDTVRLNLPGVARAASLRPAQAAKLLRQYLKLSEEREFTLREIRQLAPDHAYAEVLRRYVVRGTTEERAETAFLGFRLLRGGWQLREVRITP
jgi:hypothetical protein